MGEILNDSLCDSAYFILLDKCYQDLQKPRSKPNAQTRWTMRATL